MNSCFFIGHREANDEILLYVKKAAGELIRQEAVRDFYVGGYGGFDRIAGEAISQLKMAFPFIRLFRVLPYHPVDKTIELPDYFNGTYYPDGLEYIKYKDGGVFFAKRVD